jgi:hypothetical protein
VTPVPLGITVTDLGYIVNLCLIKGLKGIEICIMFRFFTVHQKVPLPEEMFGKRKYLNK